ncbi:serine protease gd-like [Episyrphus balteatus]|uniref:serine protease gd-like n=1 Tax=Episyrphus balteatus TaxID=286459 RepID=UPI0024859A6F|nr:serine protease gd-like [Episyrphus balteatus]
MFLKFDSLSVSVIIIGMVYLCEMSSCQINNNNYLPDVPCPNVFQYSYMGSEIIGVVTIADVRHGQTRIVVQLSQPGAYNLQYFGKLSLNLNKDKAFEFINRGLPLTYRVDFPLQNVIPRVTSITVNGMQICFGTKYDLPSTTMTLEHTLTTYQPNYYRNPSSNFWQPNYNKDSNFRSSSFPESFNQPSFSQQPSPPFNHQPVGDQSNNQPSLDPQIYTKPNESSEQNSKTLENLFSNFFHENRPAVNNVPTFSPTKAILTESQFEESLGPSPSSPTKPPTIQATFEYINSVCGQENVNFNIERLNVKGSFISKSRFPWIAAVMRRTNGDFAFQCGGSLISTRTVISAAHCFHLGFEEIKPENILISMGLYDLTRWYDAKNIGAEEIIPHPDYNMKLIQFDADLALVRLKESVIFTTSVRPICMWQGSVDTRDIEGISGAIVGWGSDGQRKTTIVPTLVNATIVSEITCIRSNDLFISLTSNRTLCAGNLDGTGPCVGDSGNGLMIRKRNKWMLRGTVSAALGNPTQQCPLDEYVVYSDAAKFLEWIRLNMLL